MALVLQVVNIIISSIVVVLNILQNLQYGIYLLAVTILSSKHLVVWCVN